MYRADRIIIIIVIDELTIFFATIVRKCAVKSCPNLSNKPIARIHGFPDKFKRPALRNKWIDLTVNVSEQNEIVLDHYGVCSDHFMPVDYKLEIIIQY